MKRLIIVGSPRTSGRSAHLAEMLFEANIDEHPEDELFLVPVSEVEIGPCVGCNACRQKSGVILKGDDGQEMTLQKHRCVFDDDMQTLYDLIDDVDEVTVVSPVYFSGAPAPMKCVLDRLQPYFWARMELKEDGQPVPEKRPLTLHVLGEGGDPHGYDALISEVMSAFAVADFRLERVLDWVGKIDEAGQITAEAEEVALEAQAASGSAMGQRAESEKSGQPPLKSQQEGVKPRPKLNLHAGIAEADPAPKAGSPRKQQGNGGGSRPSSGASPSAKKPRRAGGATSSKKQGKRRGK